MIKRKFKIFFLFGLICLFFVVATEAHALSDKIYRDISTFSKVLYLVDEYYVDDVDESEMMVGAINGMLNSLDPHTIYLPPEDLKNFSSETRGRFGGIGIEVSVKDGILTVVSPLEGTPAWTAGIKAGDKILTIDGKSTKRMTLTDAVKLMRGSIGRKITLTIWREGKKSAKTIVLTRRMIHIPAVTTVDLGKGYALFRIITFQEGVGKQLRKEVKQFQEKHGKLKGLILDLRDNPGGLLSEAVEVCDLFMKKGVIVSTKGRNKKSEVKRAHAAGTFPNIPTVVLVNEGSASASEIVAGAFQDNRRGKIIGTTSFGKGSVQTLMNLDNGGAIKITIAHYFTPKNRMIDGKGISPDIKLDMKSYLRKKKIKKKKESSSKTITREEFYKYQRDAALAYLKRLGR